MANCKILLTAFCGTSAERFLNQSHDFQTLFLPNNKVKDSEIVIETIANEYYNYVFCFGQKPLIRDKVYIETTAKECQISIDTLFDCNELKCYFAENGINAKISHNAGTSYCNKLYFNCLRYVEQNKLKTRIVFIHIPFYDNITNVDLFFKMIKNTIEMYSI